MDEAPAPSTSLAGPRWFLPGGEETSAGRVAGMGVRADYILVGEYHSSPCDHLAQAELIRALGGLPLAPAIGFEMVPAEKQPVLDRFNQGNLTLAELPEALEWEDTWGFPFDAYEDLFRAAREKDLPVAALNAPFDLSREAGRLGMENLPPGDRARLPEEIIGPPDAQQQTLLESLALHMDNPHSNATGEKRPMPELPPERVERFFLVQSIWDTKMAEEARAANRRFTRPVAVMAGGGHVEYGWGIAHRLKALEPKARILAVMPWRGPLAGGPDLDDLAADAYYYCPPTHRSRLGMMLLQEEGGVTVTGVRPGSRADEAGLEKGDLVVAAGGEPVSELEDLHKAGAAAYRAGENLVFTVLRGGERVKVDFGPLGRGGPK